MRREIKMKKTSLLILVFVISVVYSGAADITATSQPLKIVGKKGCSRGQLGFVADYCNIESTIRPSHSSIPYSVGCGTENSQQPFQKVTPGSNDIGKIIGGADADPGEFPWQISLQQKTKRGRQHICGGSIVSEDIIVTASHCVHTTKPSDLLIVAGADNLYSFTGSEQVRGVKTILEKDYDPKTFARDIALLVLDKPLKFDRFSVAPVCLPDSDFVYDGLTGVITGWGRLSEAGRLPSTLQVVSVPLISPEKCSKLYDRAGYGEHIGKCHVCSGSDEGGVDSCQGDSGGPLTCVESDGRHYLCGIVSWGIGCARPDYPGVYTFTPCFSNWIAEQISTYNSTAL